MLYLISGASRSGKTIIAKKIFEQRRIPYMSLDWLVMGFTNGLPKNGIHDKLFPDEIAEKIWNFLKAMCESMLWSEIDYVIEGEAILPELVRELLEKYPDKIRICFLGYTDIDRAQKLRDLKTFNSGKKDWLLKESDEYIIRHIDNMVKHSRRIKESCEKYDIRYFDTSTEFVMAVEEATEYLLMKI